MSEKTLLKYLVIGILIVALIVMIILNPMKDQDNDLNELTPNITPSGIGVDPNIAFRETHMSILESESTLEARMKKFLPQDPKNLINTYHVSPDGNDEFSGSRDQPWQTLAYAASKLQAGDALLIHEGVYQEMLRVSANGTEDMPILISNYENEEVIIDGIKNTYPGIDKGTPLVSILGDWVILQNVTIQYAGDMGVYTKGKYVTLNNIYVHHNRGTGVILTGDYDVIQNSRIWYNSTKNEFNKSEKGWGSGVSCARYPDHCVIRDTVAWENWGEGISTFEALNTIIENNISYDNQQNFYISDTKFTLMDGNLSYCTPGNYIDSYETQNGILVGDEKGVPIPLAENSVRYSSSDNIFINNIVVGCNRNLAAATNQSTNNLYANNTFVNADGVNKELYNILFFKGEAKNSLFINNIIVQENKLKIAISSGKGVQFTNNLWSKTPPSNMKSSQDIIGDPLFTKNGDMFTPEWYTLLQASPVIDKSQPLPEVLKDFYRYSRESFPDMGALEFRAP